MHPNYKILTAYVINELHCPTILIPPGDPREGGIGPDGIYKVKFQEPEIDPAHLALGRYLDEWNFLEHILGDLLISMLGVERSLMPTLAGNLGVRGQIETVRELSGAIFDETTAEKCSSLMDRLSSAGGIRNKLIHGYWMLEVVIGSFRNDIKHRVRPFRRYDPSSIELQDKLKNPKEHKLREKYMFGIGKIISLAGSLNELFTELQGFMNSIFPPNVYG